MSPNTSLTIIAICQLIMTAAGLVAAVALVYGVFAFKNMFSTKIDEVMDRVQPVVDRAETIAQQAKETAEHVSAKVDHIMARAESTADNVTNKVQTVSTRVEEAVSPQMVTVAGIVSTAMRVMQLYREITQSRQRPPTTTYPPTATMTE